MDPKTLRMLFQAGTESQPHEERLEESDQDRGQTQDLDPRVSGQGVRTDQTDWGPPRADRDCHARAIHFLLLEEPGDLRCAKAATGIQAFLLLGFWDHFLLSKGTHI